MNRIFATLLVAGVLTAAGAAHAATTAFDFNYSLPTTETGDFPSGFTSASGVLTVVDQGGGQYLITGITGQWNGEAITGLAPVGRYFDNDNLIFPDSDPKLDEFGFAFAVAGPILGDNGFGYVLVWHSDGDGYSDNSDFSDFIQTFDLTRHSAAPEPAGWALMLVGFGGLGAAIRTARRKGRLAPLSA
jgi:hypothetical protein